MGGNLELTLSDKEQADYEKWIDEYNNIIQTNNNWNLYLQCEELLDEIKEDLKNLNDQDIAYNAWIEHWHNKENNNESHYLLLECSVLFDEIVKGLKDLDLIDQ